MVDLLDRLITLAEQEPHHDPAGGKADPLAGLSPKEMRKRFDEYGEPREGYDVDGNPVKG